MRKNGWIDKTLRLEWKKRCKVKKESEKGGKKKEREREEDEKREKG